MYKQGVSMSPLTALVEYLKARLNPMLFKSIYQLPVMPETLKQWYKWAQKLDWQYRQVQTESKLIFFKDKLRKMIVLMLLSLLIFTSRQQSTIKHI